MKYCLASFGLGFVAFYSATFCGTSVSASVSVSSEPQSNVIDYLLSQESKFFPFSLSLAEAVQVGCLSLIVLRSLYLAFSLHE